MTMPDKKYDFSGYATRNDLVCADGRTILKDAFKQNDGQKVPLVWQHLHNDPMNVLGHAFLENRDDGVYAYCLINNTRTGLQAKELVQHGDIIALSIYANKLIEKGKVVHEGAIREVSLVLSGANPGALIDNLNIQHGDGSIVESEEEAIIFTGLPFKVETEDPPKEEKVVEHAAKDSEEETVSDVLDTLDDKQKKVVYAIIAQALGETGDDGEDLQQSNSQKGETFMKKNVFDKQDEAAETKGQPVLTHSQIQEIFADAQRTGSLKESFLAHVVTYGIENIDYLFPDARSITPTPTFVQREQGWVNVFMSNSKHNPFSRIKSLFADITLDTARALGYVKGALKKEEFFALAKRVTTPTTVYKKQKLDRDDIVDITDMDVVAWLKAEMRVMLDEEIARACLIGDGRAVESADKINETNIRPIYKDDVLYTIRVDVPAADTVDEVMEAIIRARKDYKGTGNPIMFTTSDFLTDMLLLKDTLLRRLYPTMADLLGALRVSSIVEVPVMEGVTRTDTVPDPDVVYNLLAVLVNPSDYTIGPDKGGNIAMFDDFDIDYNQYKYLMETRVSGALVNPKTAIVIEHRTA